MLRLIQTETTKVISSYSVLALSILICISFAVAGVSPTNAQQLEGLTSLANDTGKETTISDKAIIFEGPFYETTSVEVISKRIINGGDKIPSNPSEHYPQIEQTIAETGIMDGIGNVTNIGTWIDTHRAEGITFNVGQGIMSTPDGKSTAPWRAYDIGRTFENGTRTFKGLMIFNNNTNGEFESLSNVEAIYVINTAAKPPFLMWKWD
jgi:hypothetical protein